MFPFSFEKVRTEADAFRAASAGGRYIAGATRTARHSSNHNQ